jgi:hypothetical protein
MRLLKYWLIAAFLALVPFLGQVPFLGPISQAYAVDVCPAWLKGYQFNDANGVPLSNGTVRITNEGTDSLLTTYSNRQGTTPNTLDGSGRIPLDAGGKLDETVYVGITNFKFVLKDLSGTTIDSEDAVKGCLDTSGFLTGSVTAETPVITKSSDYTVLTTDQGKVISSNPTGGSFTLTLPSAVDATDGWRVTVKHAGTANTVTVQTVSAQTINGSGTSRVLSTRDESFTLVSDGANWHTDGYGIAKLTHGKFFGRTTTADGPPEIVSIPFAQVRLAKDGTSLRLSPYNGNLLTIDGKAEAVTDGGITLSASGLSNSTLYYVYAYMSAGVMTLEAVTTAYATGTGTAVGMRIKSGDSTRTLVGMCYLLAGAFVDSSTQRYVRSYFNDPGVLLSNGFTADRTRSGSNYGEFNNEIRNEFIAWEDDVAHVSAQGGLVSAGDVAYIGLQFQGGAIQDGTNRFTSSSVAGAFALSSWLTSLTEGYMYTTLLGKIASGNLVVSGAATGDRTVVKTRLQRR